MQIRICSGTLWPPGNSVYSTLVWNTDKPWMRWEHEHYSLLLIYHHSFNWRYIERVACLIHKGFLISFVWSSSVSLHLWFSAKVNGAFLHFHKICWIGASHIYYFKSYIFLVKIYDFSNTPVKTWYYFDYKIIYDGKVFFFKLRFS